MNIRINDEELEIFSGARVKDALAKFSNNEYLAVIQGEKQVKDKRNNTIDPDGELADGQQLYVN